MSKSYKKTPQKVREKSFKMMKEAKSTKKKIPYSYEEFDDIDQY